MKKMIMKLLRSALSSKHRHGYPPYGRHSSDHRHSYGDPHRRHDRYGHDYYKKRRYSSSS